MEFPMYKLIDTIKEYQRNNGKDPNIETIKGWAEFYAEEEKDFYYEKPCSNTLTYILHFAMYLLGVVSTILIISLL